jgi:hypothetical protein
MPPRARRLSDDQYEQYGAITVETVNCRLSIAVVLVLTLAGANDVQGQADKISAEGTRRSVTLSGDERVSVIARVLAHPGVSGSATGHRLAGIRATATTTTSVSGQSRSIVTVILFDHTALETRRVSIDAVTNVLIADEVVSGHPQRSPEELEEASAIIRQDEALGQLLDQGAVLDGGFIVDDPVGSRRRMIQFKLVSGDRRALLRTITIDLTLQRVAR